MKKILILLMVLTSIYLIGCTKNNKDVIKKMKDNVDSMTSYHIKGELGIVNNEDIYKYDVDVSYKANDLFRVSLKNINNNHTQILLKNEEGVYVLTPALNKSFKFQSDWPYNNSQIYLLQSILKDIEADSNVKVIEDGKSYIITSKVNYSNNDSLVKQKVYLDSDYNIKKVEVLDNDDVVLMNMSFNSINERPNFSDDYFDLDSSINTSINDNAIEVSKIESIIYPMYIPDKTYLLDQDKISTPEGERVILTFDGDNPFMFIEETSTILKDHTIIPINGNPEIIGDAIGVVSNNSVSWSSGGIDYYVTSNSLSEKELLTVANSINVMPVGK